MNAEKEGLKRVLRYFLCQAQLYVLYIAAGAFVFALYNLIVKGAAVNIEQIMQVMPGMNVSITMIVLLVVDASDGQIWYSICISFGCRRKNLFLGILFLNILVIAESMLLFWAGSKIFIQGAMLWTMPTVAALYLITAGIAQFTGIAVIKWGKAIYVLLVVGIAVGTFIMGIAAAVITGREFMEMVEIKLSQPRQQGIALLAAAVFYMAVSAVSYRLIKSYEVRT